MSIMPTAEADENPKTPHHGHGGVAMPGTRYFFHVTESDLFYPDQHGTWFSTLAEAIACAHQTARELANDPASTGFIVTVQDAAGKEIARVSLRVEDHQ
jgi:hypothetical protein